jgi:hypothetical protein
MIPRATPREVQMGRTPHQAAVDAALVAVCRGEAPALPDDPAATADFVVAARYHRIAPLAHVATRDSHPEVAQLLRSDRDRALMNHLRMSALLGGIAQALGDIPWVVFKGPVLSEFAHPLPGLRFYKDLDLLVAPGDFRTACHRLFDAGWQVVVGDSSLQSDEFPGEIPLVSEHGAVMDLHWSMLVMKSVRGRFSVAAGPLLERRVPVMIGPVKLSALEPADALVHVCHHAALIGATRLGHILDADQLARQVTDWSALVARAKEWGAAPQVAVVLGRARLLFGTPVPDDLNGRLGLSSGLTRAMELVDRRWPVSQLRREESWVRLVTRSLRPSLPRTAAVAIRRIAQGVVTRLRPKQTEAPRSQASPAVIEEYLTNVEATGSG